MGVSSDGCACSGVQLGRWKHLMKTLPLVLCLLVSLASAPATTAGEPGQRIVSGQHNFIGSRTVVVLR